jgi:hypothetical protein
MATLFIDAEGKRFNIYAPHKDASGATHVKINTPEGRALFGLTEIQEPAPPCDYSEEAYYKHELDVAPYVEYVMKPIEQLIEMKKKKIEEKYLEKLYTNTTALFPSGEKTIQFRDDRDLLNFNTVVLAAITRQAAKREDSMVEFRTEDNVTQSVPASEFIPVALDVLDAKQAAWKIKIAHKDAVSALTTQAEVMAYDETESWPETNEQAWVQLERSAKIYKAMIRRRAARLSAEGLWLEALNLLKTIGE